MKKEELMEKIKKFKKSDLMDLSSKEDLAIGIMNLISLEEHFFFTYNKTKKKEYLSLLNSVRSLRKKYLAEIVKNPEGEIWCISKHLLATAMRFMEVGTKKLGEKKEKEAKELFDDSYSLWNLFWGLNLDLLDVKDIKIEKDNENYSFKKEEYDEKDKNENKDKEKENQENGGGGKSFFGKLGKVIEKILDCCRE